MPIITCLSPVIKDAFLEALREEGASAEELANVAKMASCRSGSIGFKKGGKSGGGTRAKRAPSAYNIFIGECMRGKNIKGAGNAAPAMKDCAAEWRQRKGE